MDDLEVIAHLAGCENGACSTIWRSRTTGDVVIRGQLPDGTEGDVRIPADEWAVLRPQLP